MFSMVYANLSNFSINAHKCMRHNGITGIVCENGSNMTQIDIPLGENVNGGKNMMEKNQTYWPGSQVVLCHGFF